MNRQLAEKLYILNTEHGYSVFDLAVIYDMTQTGVRNLIKQYRETFTQSN